MDRNQTPKAPGAIKTRMLNLRKMPPDVYKIILEAQGKKKAECGCQFSLEQTVYMLIRKYAKLENNE